MEQGATHIVQSGGEGSRHPLKSDKENRKQKLKSGNQGESDWTGKEWEEIANPSWRLTDNLADLQKPLRSETSEHLWSGDFRGGREDCELETDELSRLDGGKNGCRARWRARDRRESDPVEVTGPSLTSIRPNYGPRGL